MNEVGTTGLSTLRASAPAPAAPSADRAVLTESIIDRLTAMYARRERAKFRAAAWHGASMEQFHVLVQLAEEGELPMTALARDLRVSFPSMTGIADRMEGHGLIERVRDEQDRRIVRCRLTAAGRERLSDFETMHHDKIARVLAHLNDRQLHRLDASLTDLMAAFGEADACGELATDQPMENA